MTVQEAPTRPGPRIITRRIGSIALPILLTSLVAMFAPLVNAAIIGRNDPANLYVLALALPVILLQNSVNESLRVSSVAFSSQASGSRDKPTFRRRLKSLLILGVGVNLSLALSFLVLHGLFLRMFAVPSDRQQLVYLYIMMNILTGLLLMVSTGLMSSLYGLGEVRSVTVVTMLGFSAGVAMTALLVGWLGLFALPVSTTTTGLATIWWAGRRLSRSQLLPRLTGGETKGLLTVWREICRISLPVSFGYLVIFINSLVFTHILSVFSPDVVAGFGIAYRVQNLVLMPAIALGVGLAINVNRMVAAQEHRNVGAYLNTTLGLGFLTFLALGALVLAGRRVLTGWLTTDPTIAQNAATYLAYLAPAYLVAGPLLTLMIFLEETGNGFRALLFNVFLVAVQLVLAFSLARTYHSLPLLYLALALTYLLAIAFVFHELIRTRRLGGRVSKIDLT